MMPTAPCRSTERPATVLATPRRPSPGASLPVGAALLAALLAAAPAAADDHARDGHDGGDHGEMSGEHGDMAGDDESPAARAYREVGERMHEAMGDDLTGDPDVDFARGMIPHHRGAIGMAEVLLEHGEDEALRELAREIIEAQEAEIEFLERWLEENAG
jgi:uncharacterized protein (DUF305 family)